MLKFTLILNLCAFLICVENSNSYNFKDMTNLFLTMKLLKKFEFPEDFQKNYNEDIMNKSGKESLTHFQEKELSSNNNYKYNSRDRANTYQDQSYSYNSRSKLLFNII